MPPARASPREARPVAAKAVQTIQTGGENINIKFGPDGRHIAVGNRVRPAV